MTDNRYSRRATAALIFSTDALGGALLGAAVELLGYRPSFPRDGESISAVLWRVKPSVVLVDAEDPRLGDSGAFGPSMMMEVRLFIFGRRARLDAVSDVAARYRARTILLPDDIHRLAEQLAPPAGGRATVIED